VIRWAADAESGAPYVFQDPANPTRIIGFEAEIVRAIGRAVGYRTEFVQNSWDGLIPGISRGDYDIAINGLEVTGDRAKQVNFSDVYYITYEQIIVRKGTNNINKITDLFEKRVGTLKGSLAERILNDYDDIIVASYGSESSSFKDLANGRLDAVLIDEPVAKYYAAWRDEYDLVGGPIGEVNYAIVVKDDQYFLDSVINEGLRRITASGELRQILEGWDLWNPVMGEVLNDNTEVNNPHDNYKRFIAFNNQEKDFEYYKDLYLNKGLPLYSKAAVKTLELTLLAMVLAIVFGLVLAIMRAYGPSPIKLLAVLYIEIVRGTPLLVQLYLIYYGLPAVGIKIDPTLAGIIGLGLNYAAYEAENYRAGLNSVPRGQMEVALSLGMTRTQALKHIILPQAFRLVIPPMTNDFISLLKDSSLVSIITIVELTNQYSKLASTYYDFVGFGLMAAGVYLIIGLPFVWLSRYAEKRFSIHKNYRK
jgi:polar amino acid transport system substrate-binding protein